jgi:hypothetical protein
MIGHMNKLASKPSCEETILTPAMIIPSPIKPVLWLMLSFRPSSVDFINIRSRLSARSSFPDFIFQKGSCMIKKWLFTKTWT